MAGEKRFFHVADYCVFAASLLTSMAIGLYYACSGNKQRTKGEYLMGNRQMSVVPVSISMMVSLVSANTLLGVPAEMYAYGINVWLTGIGAVLSILIAAFTFVPLLYPLKITSCYEYLQLRFQSPYPKYAASALFILKQLLYIGTVLFGPATALEAVTGLPATVSIITVTTVGTMYTALGGMKAVIWTDVFQSCIMVAGMLALVIQGSTKVGGFKTVFDINHQDKRIDFSDFFAFPGSQRWTLWTAVLCMTLSWLSEYSVNQPTSQRFCSVASQTKAKIAVLLCIPTHTLIMSLTSLAGIVAYAYFAQIGCDPLHSGEITNSNQVLALFTMEILGYPGLPGLIIACIFSGSLSTISSSLNSMAACVWEDFLRGHLPYLSESRVTVLMKIMVVVFGACCMGTAFLTAAIGGTMWLVSTSFINLVAAPTLGMYVLGGVFGFTSGWGALVGALVGFAVPTWLLFGYMSLGIQHRTLPGRIYGCPLPGLNESMYNISYILHGVANITSFTDSTHPMTTATTSVSITEELSVLDQLYSIHYMWHLVIGFLATIVVGCFVSLCTGGRQITASKQLICPFTRQCVGRDEEDERDGDTCLYDVEREMAAIKKPLNAHC